MSWVGGLVVDVQTLLLVIAVILFVIGAVLAGMARDMVRLLAMAGLAFLALAFLVPLI